MRIKRLGFVAPLLTLFAFLSITILQPSSSAQIHRIEQAAWGVRGRTAINQNARRLPLIAARYQLTPEALTQELESDSNLWIDRESRLVFLDEFVPEEAPEKAEDTKIAAAAFPYSETFKLHSLPGSTKVIYLDFNGQTTSGTAWNSSFTGGANIVSAPYEADNPATPGTFSNNEHDRMQGIWQRVAEDYLPFGVDVTTEDPGIEALRNTGGSDQAWGIRVVISPTNWYNANAGGVTYLGSFNWDSDTPCWAFTAQLGNGDEKATAEAISHEVGHSLGLFHDGKTDGTAYYTGHGTEPLGWAPIMGVGYYKSITQWSKGEYALANQTQDDLAVMTTGYGVSYRTDDRGDTIATATPLTVTNSTTVTGKGIIERTTDKDCFSFTTGAGPITLNITGGARGPNLDIKADLLNASGTVVVSSNPAGLNANITSTVAAGTYYLLIDGVGTGNPTTGYSDYGSLGEYNIAGTIVASAQPPTAVASANVTSGLAPLTVNFSSTGSTDANGNIVSYAWNFGNSTTSTQANPSAVYTNPGTYTAVLTVTDNDGLTGTANVVITVVALPNAPSNLVATAISNSQINLTWLDNANNESGFQIERSIDNSTWSPLGSVSPNIQAYSSTGLSTTTAYYYRVRAYNSNGNSAYSNTANATTLSAPPYTDYVAASETPVAGTLTGTYANTLTNDGTNQTVTEILSSGSTTTRYNYLEHRWRFNVTAGYGTTFYVNAWKTTSSDADNFQFAYSTDNSTFTSMITITNTTGGSYQSYALPTNLTGAVYIRVIDTDRTKGKTTLDKVMVDHMYIRVINTPPPPPTAPTTLTAVATSSSQINLTWVDTASNETGFQIERSMDGNTWTSMGTTAANTTTSSQTGLNTSTTYWYRVRAYNLGGNSAYSNSVSATTQALPTMHIGNLTGTTTKGTSGKWNASLTFTTHSAAEALLATVVVSGTWSNGATGTGSCTTNSSGTCAITLSNIVSTSTGVTFTVNSLTRSGYAYAANANHDPDGSSNGTIIVFKKP